ISETVGAYKPHRRMFEAALEQLGLSPYEVLHVGDSDVDDVKGAKAAGLRVAWVNRDGRPRRPDVPAPDFEIRDLTALFPLLWGAAARGPRGDRGARPDRPVGRDVPCGSFQPIQSQIARPITSSRSRPSSHGSSSVNIVMHCRQEQGMRVMSVP